MGNLALPCRSLAFSCLRIILRSSLFLYCDCNLLQPLQHVKELSMCKCNTLILHLSIVLSYFNLNLTQIGLIVK